MLHKPIHEGLRPERKTLMENYFAHYKLILKGFNFSFVFIAFSYYAFCALNILSAIVLLLYVYIEVAGKYMG